MNKETYKLINWNLLKSAKKKPILVNTSRSEILDQKSIIKAINKKILSGVALDFLEKKKNLYTKDSVKLITLAKKNTNIILTPHIGGATQQSFDNTEKFVFENFVKHI